MAEASVRDVDRRLMRMACRLALKAAGRTSPNPMVGAVLVRDGKIVGTGYHKAAGTDHAEIVALKRAGENARGATLFINLEPCSHFGRTPPCSRALIAAGIKSVVAGMRDPNPLVAGRGFRELKRAGIAIRYGVLEDECRELNEAFVKYITRGLPFVTLKLAASLDGKIATQSGDSRWISGEKSRATVHKLRDKVDAVLVGSGTVIADDPLLTCRIPGGRNPRRVVLDGRLRIPPAARVLRQPDREKTLIITSRRAPVRRERALAAQGAQILRVPERDGTLSWRAVLNQLASLGIQSILIEGGAATAASALKEKAVDKILLFYAPKIIGGDGRVMIDRLGIRSANEALQVRRFAIARSGEDILLTGYL
ncbi:MAG TPA: bifunctional diaminohydroxyphosphoribosylaminopyrimidine deaminase/5-amino-6-(5-phosphoribosylamino)uracil reductase RibD [Candidatus Binatia bacterium]|nr:bifunctional diaminohydroxyphosphoribosylaminopyrimidine deaminase/5-amino-6-(5-phosphoribosylamino)uracil reductase RibD [Candidatus Binatia bacterium]